jgi:peroxiredoxin
MKNRLTLLSIVISCLFISCADKNMFTISGDVAHPGSLTKIYLVDADSTSLTVVDSTQLSSDGKFKFKHSAPYAGLYKLRIGGSIFDLIAKNGDDINFSTDISDPARTYTITGSVESDKIKDFNKLNNIYSDKTSALYNEYQTKAQALGKETDSLIAVYRPQFQVIMDEQSQATLKFINDNKNSLAAFYAATSLDPDKYEEQLIAYADQIKDEFKDNASVQQFERQMAAAKPVAIGQHAPDFTVVGIDDKPIKLSDYKGKYVMLDFWASWCGPCRQENPNVVKQYAIYKNKGLNILGISLDVDKAKWQQAITADNLTWTHASDLKNFDGPTERLYHIEAIPSNFIIDPQGVIIAKNVRGADLEDFLNKTFNKPQ